MAEESKALEVEKQEITNAEEGERTRECSCFIPRADIYEAENEIVIVADLPGVNQNNVEITLEKNVLTIDAYIDPQAPQGYSLTYAEYESGDYQRSFRLSDEIDREEIRATIKDGVLHLHLPKAKEAMARQISVKAG